MKETADMLHWLRELAMPVDRYRSLPEAERKAHFPIGTLVNRDELDFNGRYEIIRARARKAGRGG
jgi:hypothetical protein